MDIPIFVDDPDTVQNLKLFHVSGEFEGMDGFYATVMQWLKLLFTIPGSDVNAPRDGTALAALIGGVFVDQPTLQDTAILSVADATNQLRAYQAADASLSDSTKLLNTAVKSVIPLEFGVDLTVQFTAADGKSLVVNVPLSTYMPEAQ